MGRAAPLGDVPFRSRPRAAPTRAPVTGRRVNPIRYQRDAVEPRPAPEGHGDAAWEGTAALPRIATVPRGARRLGTGGRLLRKIMMLMVVVTVATPVLRAMLESDPDAQRFGWVGSLPGMGGAAPAATAPPATKAPAGPASAVSAPAVSASTGPTPIGPTPAGPTPAGPTPGLQAQGARAAVAAMPMVRKPGDGQRPPAATSPGPPQNQGLGADGIVSPELMRFLNPSFVPGQPGAAPGGGTAGASPGAGAAGASPPSDASAPEMLKSLVARIRANPAAFKDQIAAVAKLLGGK